MNPGPQDGRHRGYHRAMTGTHFTETLALVGYSLTCFFLIAIEA